MKTCPQCRSQFPEDYIFCLNDGTALGEIEQETVVQNKVVFGGQTSSLAPDMLIVCASCGLATAPDAIGASELANIETIRRKKQECENMAAYYNY